MLSSGFWSVECAQSGNPESVFFSHEFRKMLGYHDTLDFPNNLETWERGIHPRDLEEVSRTFQEAFQDKTNEKKYDVEYRMRMADGTYQWFKDKGEVSRRADGTAFRMAGIFINIDAEKRARQYTQRVDAFHRAYTTANLCEYYVDLQENSFNSLKVEEIGIDGEWVTSGEEAVNLVAARYEKENDYFAIIIDWKMPGMDGLETTRQIRKIVGNDVTIIILSAYDYSEIAKEIIGMTGAEVVTAENGKTAVDMISSGSEGDFDLIFMDIQMPVMNGYEATAAIRTSNIPAARSVPIVAMTANAFTEDVQLARSAGMNEHISKPLDMTRLRDVMRKWL